VILVFTTWFSRLASGYSCHLSLIMSLCVKEHAPLEPGRKKGIADCKLMLYFL
jgi:hypothetical protein